MELLYPRESSRNGFKEGGNRKELQAAEVRPAILLNNDTQSTQNVTESLSLTLRTSPPSSVGHSVPPPVAHGGYNSSPLPRSFPFSFSSSLHHQHRDNRPSRDPCCKARRLLVAGLARTNPLDCSSRQRHCKNIDSPSLPLRKLALHLTHRCRKQPSHQCCPTRPFNLQTRRCSRPRRYRVHRSTHRAMSMAPPRLPRPMAGRRLARSPPSPIA